MRYTNPVVKGFYPDPSVCFAEGKYYLVCSSFQYFPGVPLFESEDLVNWRQIGHVLTRKSQVMLEKVRSSGGVFAPTIRYDNGRFYMTTNNNSTNENFYVYTDDIYGEWSDPVIVEQDGIDPSIYFEDGRAYYMSNGHDAAGVSGIVQCEIDIATGKKLTESRLIWQGSGGRYLESPHLYRIGDFYYLVAAEGGTEYGHMVTYARSKSLWGPFEGYPANPVLTNRNKAPYIIQGIGHGDLVQDKTGGWHILTLGFRQIGEWMPFHHLGREVFLTPVSFREDGWFTAGIDGTTEESYEIAGSFVQQEKRCDTFENTDWGLDWCYLRHPHMENYEHGMGKIVLHGTNVTLDEVDSPTFIGIRQRDFIMQLSCEVALAEQQTCGVSDETVQCVPGVRDEAGITVYMTEKEHYEIALRRTAKGTEAVLRLNIGGIHHVQNTVILKNNAARLLIESDAEEYRFLLAPSDAAGASGAPVLLGTGKSKYLSSEVAEGFTGVVIGLYAVGGCSAEFTHFLLEYEK